MAENRQKYQVVKKVKFLNALMSIYYLNVCENDNKIPCHKFCGTNAHFLLLAIYNIFR